jgi:thiol-disulfide isomerase/thioredoxin
MVRKSIVLSLLVISIQGCNHNNTVTISGSLDNVTDKSFSVTIGSDPRTLLKAERNAMVCEILEDGSFSFTVDAFYPHRVTLVSENHQFISNVLIIHGGETHISADCINTIETIEYSGDNGEINNFYREWSRFYNKAYRDLNAEETNYNQLLIKLDSVVDLYKIMLQDYLEENTLSKTEIQWLSSNMKYRKYTSLLGRAKRLNSEPDGLDFSFFRTLDLTDEEACEIYQAYNRLTYRYILNLVNTQGIYFESSGDNTKFYDSFYRTIMEELNGKVRDVVLSCFITDLLSRNETCATEYYDRFQAHCKSKELRKMAESLYLEYFSLTESGVDSGVEFIQIDNQPPMEVLSRFENKVVYLDFWASWCSPCIAAIPHTMALANHYQHEDVVVIFVGHSDQRSSLENAIKKHNILGKHFILDEKESEIWKMEFEVGGIPSYVLLDRNQKVVEFNAPHPDEELIFEMIDSLLLKK